MFYLWNSEISLFVLFFCTILRLISKWFLARKILHFPFFNFIYLSQKLGDLWTKKMYEVEKLKICNNNKKKLKFSIPTYGDCRRNASQAELSNYKAALSWLILWSSLIILSPTDANVQKIQLYFCLIAGSWPIFSVETEQWSQWRKKYPKVNELKQPKSLQTDNIRQKTTDSTYSS